MEGGAHQRHPDELAFEQLLPERRRVERLHAGPETDVRVERDLRLQPDEALDGGERGSLDPLEQELAGKQRPVERAAIENRALGGVSHSARGRARVEPSAKLLPGGQGLEAWKPTG